MVRVDLGGRRIIKKKSFVLLLQIKILETIGPFIHLARLIQYQ